MRFFKSNRKTSQSDADLIAEYKRTGNNHLIAILFDRYAHLIYAICMKYLKDEEESRDAVINIFEKLLLSLNRYEIKNFGTWIHSVARNYCFAQLQQSKTKTRHHETAFNEDTSAQFIYNPDDFEEEEELKALELQKLKEAMQALNNEQKICVELFYLKKHCYNEISEITGYSLNQVKSYIQNGKRNLKIGLTRK